MSKGLICMEHILGTYCLHPSKPLLELMQDNDQHSCFSSYYIDVPLELCVETIANLYIAIFLFESNVGCGFEVQIEFELQNRDYKKNISSLDMHTFKEMPFINY